WDEVESYVEKERFVYVQGRLREQAINAQDWKDACLLYFQQFNKLPIPYDIERPVNKLEDIIKKDRERKNQ
ncbi:MAG: alpha-glucuronidase, partial [Bacteroidales bacterium]|nr:alpha-glucuronidase [Bacteroidales bacterium]